MVQILYNYTKVNYGTGKTEDVGPLTKDWKGKRLSKEVTVDVPNNVEKEGIYEV